MDGKFRSGAFVNCALLATIALLLNESEVASVDQKRTLAVQKLPRGQHATKTKNKYHQRRSSHDRLLSLEDFSSLEHDAGLDLDDLDFTEFKYPPQKEYRGNQHPYPDFLDVSLSLPKKPTAQQSADKKRNKVAVSPQDDDHNNDEEEEYDSSEEESEASANTGTKRKLSTVGKKSSTGASQVPFTKTMHAVHKGTTARSSRQKSTTSSVNTTKTSRIVTTKSLSVAKRGSGTTPAMTKISDEATPSTSSNQHLTDELQKLKYSFENRSPGLGNSPAVKLIDSKPEAGQFAALTFNGPQNQIELIYEPSLDGQQSPRIIIKGLDQPRGNTVLKAQEPIQRRMVRDGTSAENDLDEDASAGIAENKSSNGRRGHNSASKRYRNADFGYSHRALKSLLEAKLDNAMAYLKKELNDIKEIQKRHMRRAVRMRRNHLLNRQPYAGPPSMLQLEDYSLDNTGLTILKAKQPNHAGPASKRGVVVGRSETGLRKSSPSQEANGDPDNRPGQSKQTTSVLRRREAPAAKIVIVQAELPRKAELQREGKLSDAASSKDNGPLSSPLKSTSYKQGKKNHRKSLSKEQKPQKRLTGSSNVLESSGANNSPKSRRTLKQGPNFESLSRIINSIVDLLAKTPKATKPSGH